MIKYEATRIYGPTETTKYRQTEQEFDTMEEAEAYTVADQDELGYRGGNIVTWHVGPNLPGCSPALKYSSCALKYFDHETQAWRDVNIF